MLQDLCPSASHISQHSQSFFCLMEDSVNQTCLSLWHNSWKKHGEGNIYSHPWAQRFQVMVFLALLTQHPHSRASSQQKHLIDTTHRKPGMAMESGTAFKVTDLSPLFLPQAYILMFPPFFRNCASHWWPGAKHMLTWRNTIYSDHHQNNMWQSFIAL